MCTEYGSPLGFCVHSELRFSVVIKQRIFFLILAFFALKKFWLDCLS